MKERLKKALETHGAKIGVIGMGYVGLPLVIRFGSRGFHVYGFDIDAKKIASLKKGESYIDHIPSDKIKALVDEGRFLPTDDYRMMSDVDVLIICVPTPLTKMQEPDLRFVRETSREVVENGKKGQLVVLESTTYPGTTREILLPGLTEKFGEVGKDFFLAYSPEREDPGNPVFTTEKIPKVVGGITEACRECAVALYSEVIEKVVPVSSTEVAEFTKLLENIYRSINIALVNELKVLAMRMGIDIWEVIDAAASKPFGYHPFYPGPGLGGHCIPIDPFYLSWKARQYDFANRFIQLSGEINTSMPGFVVSKLTDALNSEKKSLNGSGVLVLGIAYKKNVDDLRESPSLTIIEKLLKKGARVSYHDPHIPVIPKTRKHTFDFRSVPLNEAVIHDADAVLVLTDHDGIDYEWVAKNSRLFVDTRNVSQGFGKKYKNIIKS
ncbi:MAG: nucleotide sugar dehydrogenase [Nitrospiraceae bacterium]|nr:nucleotide sugar dehydrogenase [Nitrospiraceae bacterium]